MDVPPSPTSVEVEAFQVLEHLKSLDKQGREAFLNDKCSRPEVRSLVHRMLSAHDAGFLDHSPEIHQFCAGDVLAGRYVIKKLVGSGGMGEVYEVFDRALEEDIALKLVHPWIAESDQGRERFIREARIAKKVAHENLCRVHDASTVQVRPGSPPLLVLSMELLRGESLAEIIRKEGPLPDGEAAVILRQVCAALSSLHKSGIIHRDLKAANVIVIRSYNSARAVVTDFGLARSLSDSNLTRIGQVVGTLYSMAPEQALGDSSAASDIWALGVLMYEMMVGHRPFQGRFGRSEVVEATLRSESRGYSSSWSSAVCKCLTLDPKHRYQTVEALLTDVLRGDTRIRRRNLLWVGATTGSATVVAFLASRSWSSSPSTVPALSAPPSPTNSLSSSVPKSKTVQRQAKPRLLVSPAELHFRVTRDSPDSDEMVVHVGQGSQRFRFATLPSQSWILLRSHEDEAPGQLHVGVEASGMVPGTYVGFIEVLSDEALGGPMKIKILMEVIEGSKVR